MLTAIKKFFILILDIQPPVPSKVPLLILDDELFPESLESKIARTHIVRREAYYKTSMLKVPAYLYDEYREYLKTSEWRTLQYAILERDGYTCTACGSPSPLEIHHTSYRGIFEMNFVSTQLTTLCTPCHKAEHSKGIK